MLENSFIHIPGIGEATERKLWEGGVFQWRDFLHTSRSFLSPGRDTIARQVLHESLSHKEDISFFAGLFPQREMWRLFEAFKDRCVYLDIETSGGVGGWEEITVIGLYNGVEVKSFINGVNLDSFEIEIARYDVVVTFNGTCFDLPYIRRSFPSISLPPVHVDVRFLMGRLGYRGGLKKIERCCGIVRDNDIAGMEGLEAVRLWQEHLCGDDSALERLVRYNSADIVNLKPLVEKGFNEMRRKILPAAAW
jgi:uncharacterized protein